MCSSQVVFLLKSLWSKKAEWSFLRELKYWSQTVTASGWEGDFHGGARMGRPQTFWEALWLRSLGSPALIPAHLSLSPSLFSLGLASGGQKQPHPREPQISCPRFIPYPKFQNALEKSPRKHLPFPNSGLKEIEARV